MKKEIYLAAAEGNVKFLEEARTKDEEAVVPAYSDDDLMGVTSHGNNIIHIAAENGHLEFIKVAFWGFNATRRRTLICLPNNDGDTPLHMAAKLHTSTVAEHLVDVALDSCPWRIQNNEGNTPLHVALMNGGNSIQVADYLLNAGPEVASYANHRKESPLHLAVDYNNQGAKISMTNMINKLNGLGASLDYKKSLFEEDSLSVINSLLQKSAIVCCLQDVDGMTPLLRATLNSYYSAVEAMINYCPESVEICDPRGKTVLHHIKFPTLLQARNFLSTPGISAFMDRQDKDGNTPLHVAIINNDYDMVRAMFDCNANFAIKNKEGTSPATLIHSSSSSFLDKTKDYIRRSANKDEVMMGKELFEAAHKEDWQYLLGKLKEANSDDDRHFLSRLPNGTNIVHLAVMMTSISKYPSHTFKSYSDDDDDKYSSPMEEFIAEASKRFPILICQTDFRGCTPLHYAMSYVIKILMKPSGRAFKTLLDVLKQIKDRRTHYPLPPWEVKDLCGDTVLHLAIRNGRYEMAKSLIIEIMDEKMVGETNNSKETPLHFLCRYGSPIIRWKILYNLGGFEEKEREIVELLIEKDVSMVHSYDADGFTPLLRAVQNPWALQIASRIVEKYPDSIYQVDSKFGRNVLHFIDCKPGDRWAEEFINILPQMKKLKLQFDREGNDSIDLASEQGRFGTESLLRAQIWGEDYIEQGLFGKLSLQLDHFWHTSFFGKVAQEFIQSTSSKNFQTYRFCGSKSFYGVPYSNMKEFMNTLGVVAALLTTITFTAAFTVPGGYDQGGGTPGGYDKHEGTPIFSKQVAFKAFMFADVIGMCTSVMALFSIIWFFTSNEIEKEGRKFGDLSMILLQLSFHATLIAFITGVYVTTFPQIHWLAIFTCFICCLVLLLMRRRFIMVTYNFIFDSVLRGLIFLAFLTYIMNSILGNIMKTIVGCFKYRNQRDSS